MNNNSAQTPQSTPLTPEDLDNIEARESQATPSDTEMLDWIEKTEGDVSWSRKSWAIIAGQPEIQCMSADSERKPYPTFNTLREAISDAMSESKAREGRG